MYSINMKILFVLQYKTPSNIKVLHNILHICRNKQTEKISMLLILLYTDEKLYKPVAY